MNRLRVSVGRLLSLALVAGCGPAAIDAPPPRAPVVESRPAAQSPAVNVAVNPESFTWDTDRDRPFAEFLRDKSGGMLRKAAVGIERGGKFQVILDKSVAPDDTLDLVKSLMAGARKDFPDKPISLGVFDPSGELILRANYKVGQGVSYKVAHESKAEGGRQSVEDESNQPTSPVVANSNRSGTTASDRKFAEWAEEHGKAYLRYVEADLERHGRLWFGVTREVKPADVPDLTKSLLEGARKEFPKGDLVATVFDPEGNKIGKAYLTGSSSIRWER